MYYIWYIVYIKHYILYILNIIYHILYITVYTYVSYTYFIYIYFELPKKTPLESTGIGPTNRIQHCFHDPQRQGTTGRPSKTWRWNVTNKYHKFANNNGDEPTVMGIKLIKLLSNDINMYQWGYDPHRFCPMSVWAPMWDNKGQQEWQSQLVQCMKHIADLACVVCCASGTSIAFTKRDCQMSADTPVFTPYRQRSALTQDVFHDFSFRWMKVWNSSQLWRIGLLNVCPVPLLKRCHWEWQRSKLTLHSDWCHKDTTSGRVKS